MAAVVAVAGAAASVSFGRADLNGTYSTVAGLDRVAPRPVEAHRAILTEYSWELLIK